MMFLCECILFFTVYSALGWLCECVYCSIPAGKLVNRGFLTGPVCPVYGFGALLVVFLLRPVQQSLPLVFLCGMVLTSALEYATGWAMEKLFHMKWWDYSHYRFQLHGRICLLNSTMFGFLCVVVVCFLHPTLVSVVMRIHPVTQGVLTGIILGFFSCDTYLSVRTTLEISGKLQKLHEVMEELHEQGDTYVQQIRELGVDRIEEHAAYVEKRKAELEALLDAGHILNRRMIDAFPALRSNRYENTVERLREAIAVRRARRKK